jgi:hypothetical protein
LAFHQLTGLDFHGVPDIFEIVLKKLNVEGADAVGIGDTPYDA